MKPLSKSWSKSTTGLFSVSSVRVWTPTAAAVRELVCVRGAPCAWQLASLCVVILCRVTFCAQHCPLIQIWSSDRQACCCFRRPWCCSRDSIALDYVVPGLTCPSNVCKTSGRAMLSLKTNLLVPFVKLVGVRTSDGLYTPQSV